MLRIVTIETVINSNQVAQHLALHPAGVALTLMWCFCFLVTGKFAAKAGCGDCFYSEAESQYFRPAGATRCTDSCETSHPREAFGSAWPC